MPRDSGGNYTLPALGNPAVSNTTITIAWWNGTSTDMAAAFTDSLSRSGLGGMLVPFTLVDGTSSAPAFAFQNENNTGFYRATSGEMDVAVQGVQLSRWTTANGFQSTFDSGSTWKTPLYNNNGNQTFTGGLDFTLASLTVGGSFVAPHPVLSTSSSSGNYQTNSTSFTLVTNLSLSFTATGRPVFVTLVPDGTTNSAQLACGNSNTSNLNNTLTLALSLDSGVTFVAEATFGATATGFDGSAMATMAPTSPPGAFCHWFIPAMGSPTIGVYVKGTATAGTPTSAVKYCKLAVMAF